MSKQTMNKFNICSNRTIKNIKNIEQNSNKEIIVIKYLNFIIL